MSAPALPTLSAPSTVTVGSSTISVPLPSKPSGFDSYGQTMGVYIFNNSSATGTSSSYMKLTCNSWSYNSAPWNGYCSFDRSELPAGTYYARYYLTDNQGRSDWSPQRQFTFIPPVATLQAPTAVPGYSSENTVAARTPPAPSGSYGSAQSIQLYIFDAPNQTSGWINNLNPSAWNKANYFPPPGLQPGTTYYVRMYIRDQWGREIWSPDFQTQTETPVIPSSWLGVPTFLDRWPHCPNHWAGSCSIQTGDKNTSTTAKIARPAHNNNLDCAHIETIAIRVFEAESYRTTREDSSYVNATTGHVAESSSPCVGGWGGWVTISGLSPSRFYAARMVATTVWGEQIWSPPFRSGWDHTPEAFTYTAPRVDELEFLGVPQIINVSANDIEVRLPSQPSAWASITGGAELCLSIFTADNAINPFAPYNSTAFPLDGPTWAQANQGDNTQNQEVSQCWTAKGSSTPLGGNNQVPWGSTFSASNSSNIRRSIQPSTDYKIYWFLNSTNNFAGFWGNKFWFGPATVSTPSN